jgi:peroxiredoxin
MTDHVPVPLGAGDKAPDFDLPAADHDGRVSLAEYRARGPVLLLFLRGLYCPFCRRHLSQMKPTCDLLRASGINLLGVVIATPERSRLYFRFGMAPCFPVAAAPDRSLHRVYGLPERPRSPGVSQDANDAAARILRSIGIHEWSGSAAMTLHQRDTAFQLTPEDEAEYNRPIQTSGYFLVDSAGIIRWAQAPTDILTLPQGEELLGLIRG